MRPAFLLLTFLFLSVTNAEVVYVESPTDTDLDGKPDRIYVSIDRPLTSKKLSTLFYISPYALGGTNVEMHNVDLDFLPQDSSTQKRSTQTKSRNFKTSESGSVSVLTEAKQYAKVKAHSLGTGYSTGCPTVGDMSETLAAKAVIDWLNGRAKAYYQDGREAKADWANGKVGMTGTSYDGTLPIMVATTGVEGLKAIVPDAAISNWYDYYRGNGLVVNPGGYIGEDADILGYFIVRRGACKSAIDEITKTMGREHGDFSPFWQARDYVSRAKNIKAATFIIHGQSDWNVKQKNAIQLWEAIEGIVPRRMFLHRGGHGAPYNLSKKIQAWFDHFLEDEDNGITKGPQVEVELPNGTVMSQYEWPNEETQTERFYLNQKVLMSTSVFNEAKATFVDSGKSTRLQALVDKGTQNADTHLMFMTAPFKTARLISGTPKITLNLAVLNRQAANLTVALVEYDKNGKGKIITRGWADPQNHRDITQGEKLIPGQSYQVSFDLEPKQYQMTKDSRLAVLVASTDYEYTLRPKAGTQIQLSLGSQSFIEVNLSRE